MTANTPDNDTPEPASSPPDSPAKAVAKPAASNDVMPRFVPVAGYAFMFLFMFGVTGLKWVTADTNRLYWALNVGIVARHLLLHAAAALLLAAAYIALFRLTRSRPRAWSMSRHFVYGWVALIALILLPKPAAWDHLWLKLWMHVPALPWFLEKHTDLLIVLAGPLVALSPRFASSAGRILRFFAKLFSPLPVILLMHFALVPQYTIEYQDPPATPPPPEKPAPVLFIIMDALDKARTIDDEAAMTRLPHLRALVDTGTVFKDPTTPGLHTHNSMPAILYQNVHALWLPDLSCVVREGGVDTPVANLPTWYDMVGRESDTRVLIGFHLDYTSLVGGRVGWLRTINDRYAHPWESLAWNFRSHMYLFAFPGRVPFLSQSGYIQTFYDDRWAHICNDVQESCLLAIRLFGPSLVAVFHLVMPHPPFLFDRDGLRTRGSRVPTDEGYLLNMEYGDRQLGELFDELRRQGLWDAATIIVTGDHGYIWGDASRVPPIIIKTPGQRLAKIDDTPRSTARIARWLEGQPEFIALRPRGQREAEE